MSDHEPRKLKSQSPRVSFGRLPQIMEVPDLVKMQKRSYQKFTQQDVEDPAKRVTVGIEGALRSIFPIKSHNGNVILEYQGYTLGQPTFDEAECRMRGKSYAAPLNAKIRLVVSQRGTAKDAPKKELREQDSVYLGDIPMMTESGSFIINGTERVIVSQLHRSPGVIFSHDSGKTHSSGKLLYSARIIPNRGSWLDFEFDPHDLLYVRIDRHRKLPVTILLRAMGFSPPEILEKFFDNEHIDLEPDGSYTLKLVPEFQRGRTFPFAIVNKAGKVIVEAGQRLRPRHVKLLKEEGIDSLSVDQSFLLRRVLARDVCNADGELVFGANTVIDASVLEEIRELEQKSVEIIYTNDLDCGPYISETLSGDHINDQESALESIYTILRPGNPPTPEESKNLFDGLFRNPDRYDLSPVGRMKFNRRLNLEDDNRSMTLSDDDIVRVVARLIELRNGLGLVDDIDHLGNRRVRSVGEMAENRFRLGLLRIQRAVSDRLSTVEQEDGITPRDLISSKPVTGAMQEFFGWSQLSQFMDQNNPLAEVTHKRRVSALGPGGLMRGRAGFEVRDVHPTHYGRLCPIETPEGPNIGLINSLALYAQPNEFGFLETPYRKVVNGRVTKKVEYLSAINENEFYIAQASAAVDDKGQFTDELVATRHANESVLTTPDKVQYMDISPQQAVSVAASLVPFLEHDDANRALMGANMQRQAVPLLAPEAPLVGTGLEAIVAKDIGACLTAERGGIVINVNARRIVIRVNEQEIQSERPSSVDIYNLVKYARSNQNTCINQKPVVREGDKVVAGDVIADGQAVRGGELALGQNVRIAFMPWNGYNYEDSILISERVAKEDLFTSVHIQELVCVARDTKQGAEEVTADIPHISEAARAKLDESGIIHIGAEVEAGDILVGRVTPKTETRQSAVEKLLLVVFGDKATDVKDSSLKVPSGVSGTVVDVQVFVRSRDEKMADQRAMSLQTEQLQQVQRDMDEEWSIVETATYARLRKLLVGKVAVGGGVERDTRLTAKLLDGMKPVNWLKLELKEEQAQGQLKAAATQLRRYRADLEKRFGARRENITDEDDLPPNVIKQVKVSIAVKRRIQPGDKMAGRHGNKGVISSVVPVEDMPFDERGEPVDIVLNPLGVPSRMNVGQVLETHLGLAVKSIGERLNAMVKAEAGSERIREYLNRVYTIVGKDDELDKLGEKTLSRWLETYSRGLPMATPVFDGCTQDQIKQMLEVAGQPLNGQMQLFDGRTGDPYDRKITVGYMYMLKLNHLVDDKMHARSSGSYSLVTQQPLGGKAQFGGQRLGEMEVWALEAYGAAHTLQEMLTIKSDDMIGRNQIYKDIVDGRHDTAVELPESFNVLMREIRALGIDIDLERSDVSDS